ncbi:MAG: hypothetical protein CM15mP106_8220 [Candidatus Neomarinimicrobiota bacterium]|nr:MAG: hypothetical protein CM15mP106_8220 [Candidatus Neomarinimicrobiota bacterium]
MTFYKNIDQLPPFDDYDIRKGSHMYLGKSIISFLGPGLSYTDFFFNQISINNKQFSQKTLLRLTFFMKILALEKVQCPKALSNIMGKKNEGFQTYFSDQKGNFKNLFQNSLSDLDLWDSLENKFFSS